MRTNTKTIFLTLLFAVTPITAQLPEIQFENITAYDGLADDDAVWDIHQDRSGYMWFATADGLSKYDGYSFINFRYNENDSTSIAGNSINTIYEDYYGRLWFGGNDGLHLYNPIDDTFKRFQHDSTDSNSIGSDDFRGDDVADIVGDSTGLWIGLYVGGLDRLDFETMTFSHFISDSSDTASLSSDFIRKLYIDKEGILWIGSYSVFNWERHTTGLNRYIPDKKSFKRYFSNPEDDCSLADSSIFLITEDRKGDLYIGTGKSILHKYNRISDCFDRLTPNIKHNIFAPKGKSFANFKTFVTGLVEDRQGIYWVATFAGGINNFNNTKDDYKYYPNLKYEENNLATKNIVALYEDRQGNIWISAYKNGVYKVTASTRRFDQLRKYPKLISLTKNREIRVIFQDSYENFWIGTNENIIRFNPNNSSSEIISDNFDFPISFFDVFYEDEKSALWFGGVGMGLNKYDLKSGNLKRYKPNSKVKDSIPFWAVSTITRYNDSLIWIGSDESKGLASFNINSEQFKLYRHSKEDEHSISNPIIWTTFCDSKSELWIGTENGLNRYRENSDDFERYLPNHEINEIIEDGDHNLWLASKGHGLIKFDRKTSQCVYYNNENELPSNNVFSLIEDNLGNIWIGSPAGLTRLELSSMRFTTFNREDGMKSRIGRWADAAYLTKDGQLLFGGVQGITAFDPKQLTINQNPPFVKIKSLTVKNKPYKEKGSIESKILLDHDQNDISIEYVGIHFKDPKKNKYSVKLEPYESEWSNPNYQRKVRYTNLSPGEYTFHIKASNSDGIWNEEGRILSIIINPPIWATWWAYTFYVLFVGGVLYSIRRLELNRQRNNAAIKESKLRAESAELQAKAAEAQAKVIQIENDRKTKELEEARKLQLSMLPKELPRAANLDIAVYMQTATEVGGDYYDFSTKKDGSLNICLGDATGHGMKAGTIVSMMKSLFTGISAANDISEFFILSNNALKNSELDKMMMAFGMINIQENKIRISNAGIPPIFIFRSASSSVEEIKLNGLPLGAMKNTKYDSHNTDVSSGDIILMMSDGMPELRNGKDKMFGYERIKSLLENIGDRSAAEIIRELKQKGTDWVNDKDPDDDVTFVVIKVK